MRVLVDAASVTLGGGSSYLSQQLLALSEVTGWHISLVANDNSAATLNGFPVEARLSPRLSPGARELVSWSVLARRLGAYDLLYAPGNFRPPLPLSKPTVVTIQNPNYWASAASQPWNRGPARRARIALSRWSVRHASAVVLISKSLESQLRQGGHLPMGARVAVIPSGAPPTISLEGRSESGLNPGFVILGREYPHKHVDQVIEAWALYRLEARGVAKRLTVVGPYDATQRRRLAYIVKEIHEPAIADLTFTGPVANRAEIFSILKSAQALVSMSGLEAWPLTPEEAAAVGTMAILSDIPPHREVAGPHSVFVPLGDVRGLAVTLRRIAETDARSATPWRRDWTWRDNALALAGVMSSVVVRD